MTTLKAIAAAGTMLAAVLLLPGPAPAQTQQFVPRDENPEDFPAGAGRDDAFYACTACHGFKLIAQQGMNRRQWEDSVQLMTDKHGMPPLPEKDKTVVLDYLAATFPQRAPSTSRGWQNPFLPR
jgi:hypothetical protein